MVDVLMVVTPVASVDDVHPAVPPGTQLAEQGADKSHVVATVPQTDAPKAKEMNNRNILKDPMTSKKFSYLFLNSVEFGKNGRGRRA